MKTNKEIMELCKGFSKGYDEVEDFIMEWGRNNKDLKKPIQQIMALNNNPRFPEGYGGRSAANYLLSLVLTSPTAIRRLYTKAEAELTSNAKKVLSI